MTPVIAKQPPLSKQEAPTDGHILHVEAYPRDEESITLHMLYSENPEVRGSYVGRQFEIARNDAETLAKKHHAGTCRARYSNGMGSNRVRPWRRRP